MLKTLLAGTALAALLTFTAQAQETPEAQATPDALPHAETMPPREVGNQQVPSTTTEAPVVPETAEDTTVPQSEEPLIPPTAEETAPPDTMAPDTVTGAPAAPAGTLPEGWAPVDLATVSPDTLIGADIRTYDGDAIAAVEDVLMSADGKVDSVVARFGGFLGFGETRVLLTPAEIAVATDADGNVAVLTSLAADELKGRPEYAAPEGADAAG